MEALNGDLQTELDALDPQFFAEIDDLKYNYSVALKVCPPPLVSVLRWRGVCVWVCMSVCGVAWAGGLS